MQERDSAQITTLRRPVSRVLEAHGDGTHDDSQYLTGRSQRNRQGDTGTDALPTGDDQDGGDDGGQGGIRGHGGTDVHPTQGDHLQGTPDDDTGFHVAEYDTDQGTGDQRTVELKLIEDRAHPRDTCHDKYQHNLKSGNLHCTSPFTKELS
ncbi:Uncharacterised protein [Edwardsiella tarda]|nr:Uncharacterised protein [Edwardsiella tarda]